MQKLTAAIAEFTTKATAVSTTVVHAKNLKEAAEYALRLCSENVFSRPSGEPKGKVLAAPDLPKKLFDRLVESGAKADVEIIGQELRGHMDGIDVGFTSADMGIAETGTAVMRCRKEDTRLASMICETHVLALPKSKVVATLYDAEDFLREAMAGPMYTAFISGCSRTSDIERVLTLGVHGPLELHVVLTEED